MTDGFEFSERTKQLNEERWNISPGLYFVDAFLAIVPATGLGMLLIYLGVSDVIAGLIMMFLILSFGPTPAFFPDWGKYLPGGKKQEILYREYEKSMWQDIADFTGDHNVINEVLQNRGKDIEVNRGSQ